MILRTVEQDKRLAKLLDEIVDLAENNEEFFVVFSVLRAFHHIKLENRYFKPGKNRYGEWDSEAHNSKIIKMQFGQEEHGGRQ